MSRVEEDVAALGWLLPVAGSLVPAARRLDWVKEWRAELWYLRHGERRVGLPPTSQSRDVGHPHFWSFLRIDLAALSLAYGIVADAVWLRWDWVRERASTSAYACLWVLTAYCVACAITERVVEGSWGGFFRLIAAHFLGGFVFAAVPAVVAAVATYPLRPLRCNGHHAGARGRLSARARWNLFLAAKVGLTLALAFLASMVAVGPVRMAVGRYSDWFELGMYALAVTAGMRWALLDQEGRCQRCLRTLSQPMRVGPASRNFLDWSGMEQVCSDGHGRLQVAEMTGSWCWYDLWLELDSSLGGLFGS
jgi:hypothetical protein